MKFRVSLLAMPLLVGNIPWVKDAVAKTQDPTPHFLGTGTQAPKFTSIAVCTESGLFFYFSKFLIILIPSVFFVHAL